MRSTPMFNAWASRASAAWQATSPFSVPCPTIQLPGQYRRAVCPVASSIVADLPVVSDIVGEEQLAITGPPGDVAALAGVILTEIAN